MSNYIHRLRAELAQAETENMLVHARIVEFRAHLAGGKFQGFDPDGSRRDWIATADVLRWLERIVEPAEGDPLRLWCQVTTHAPEMAATGAH